MTPRTVACLVLMSFVGSAGTAAADVAQADSTRLERGSVDERRDALEAVRDLPPEGCDAAVLNAIEREAQRMLVWYRGPELVDHDVRDVYALYSMGLLRVLRESRDPRFIPIFVDFSFMFAEASTALVDFGELAVPQLVGAVRGTEDALSRRGGATSVLAEILRRSMNGAAPPLPEESRQESVALARELLGAGFPPGYVGGIARLALATQESDLRAELKELATNRAAWIRRNVTEDQLIEPGQRIVTYLLKASQP